MIIKEEITGRDTNVAYRASLQTCGVLQSVGFSSASTYTQAVGRFSIDGSHWSG